ncbi:FG-GAP repeat domain-containing protein [Plantactinospora sp. WMMC1484]|uniref:FG-GAP repeat domain-containing protein n=1 Tax=Plantactinospora sp. WMMC1484 TaxID=3404122 RepID=UPI003BF5DE45
MWRKRLAALAAAALLGSLTVVPAARAGGPGDPMWADLDGDRRLERIFPDWSRDGRQCAITIQWGGSGQVEQRPYLPPGARVPVSHCPDMGVAVDLGGNGSVELVVGSFDGTPVGAQGSIFVLRDFVPEVLARGNIQLVGMGTADFDGDRRTDVFWWTDQGAGFGTYLNTAAGHLVPGPIQQDQGEINSHWVADFDGNGAMDVVVAFHTAPSAPPLGVVVIFDDGTKVWLRQGDDGGWGVELVDANADGLPDVRTSGGDGVHTFLNRGDRTFGTGPIANDDLAHAYRSTAKVIKVRDNDVAAPAATLSIVVPPRYGFLTDHDSRYEVSYQRTASHKLSDTFVYRLDQEGLTDTGTVTVRMKD